MIVLRSLCYDVVRLSNPTKLASHPADPFAQTSEAIFVVKTQIGMLRKKLEDKLCNRLMRASGSEAA